MTMVLGPIPTCRRVTAAAACDPGSMLVSKFLSVTPEKSSDQEFSGNVRSAFYAILENRHNFGHNQTISAHGEGEREKARINYVPTSI